LLRAAELYRAGGEHEPAARCLAAGGRLKDAAREALRAPAESALEVAVESLYGYVLGNPAPGARVAQDKQLVARVGELARAAGRLSRAGEYRPALAHYLALRKLPLEGDAFRAELLAAYAGLERHGDAVWHCLRQGAPGVAHDYLDDYPDADWPIAEVERLAQDAGGRLGGVDDGDFSGVLFRVMNACLLRGREPDRRPRLTALLRGMSPEFAFWTPLSRDCSELLIALRSYDHLVGVAVYLSLSRVESAGHRYFLDRLRTVAEDERDRELALCTLLGDGAAFEAAIADLEPAPHNVALFAESDTRYREAVALLLASDKAGEAASVCVRHGDFSEGGRIYERSGDLSSAARTFRDGELYDDARRCYAARGDEAGVARVFERQRRFDEAMVIWQRLGRKREIERLARKMGRGG